MMSGLIVTLRKNPIVLVNNGKSDCSTKPKEEYIVLGHYDRLEVRESFAFSDFYYSTPSDEISNNDETENLDLYTETQWIYLLRLPGITYQESDKNNISSITEYKNGCNSSIPYLITQKRKCCV